MKAASYPRRTAINIPQWVEPHLGRLPKVLTLIVTALAVGLPLGFLLYASVLTETPGAPAARLTLRNWAEIVVEGRAAILNTLLIAFYVTIFTLLIAAVLAWIVARTDTPFRGQLSLLLVLPILVSPMLTTLAWTLLAAPGAGLINANFNLLAHVTWPLFNVISFPGIVVVMVLYFVPFAYLLLVSVLQGIDPGFEDASRLSGAGVMTTMRRITLPVVAPAILSAALLVFALASEQLAVPTLLGLQAHIPTLQYIIYVSMVDSPSNPNQAATAGCLLMVVTVVGLMLYTRALGAARRYVTVSGKASQPKLIQLGAWKFVALGFCLLYLFLAVVGPYGALILGSLMKYVTPIITPDLFTLQNYADLLESANAELAGRNTLILGLVGASLTLAAGLWISQLVTRGRSVIDRGLELTAMLPLSVPALSLALGVLWAYLFFPVGIYGTVWILLLAYLTRLNPQGIRTLSSGLIQIDPELELAARVHGASAVRAFGNVTLPLLRPALLATWTLVLVQITQDISMTLMLYTPQTTTAAIGIWFAYFGGNSALAYSMAVVLATFSLAVVFIGQRLFGFLRHVT
jgi:iron(III) transport system permease protein